MKPVRVYLDSSDYSNFARRAGPGTELAAIREQLLNWRDEGRIEIRYSFAHVLEVAPTDRAYIAAARERMAQIELLCGRKCFAAPQLLFASEAKVLAGNGGHIQVVRDDGNWFPDVFGDVEFPTAVEILREKVSKGSRHERRVAKAVYFDSQGNIRVGIGKKVAEFLPPLWKKLTDKYPFTDSALAKYQEYFMGRSPIETVLDELSASLIDLQVFATWYEKKWDTVSPLSMKLRESGVSLATTLSLIQEKGARLMDELMQKGHSKDELGRMKDHFMDEGWDNFVKKLGGSVLHTRVLSSLEPDKTPAALAIATTGATLMRITGLDTGTTRRKAKESDAIDLLHAVYLPFVDIYRADGFMAEVIREANLPFATKVVGNINQLVPAIEKALADRSSSEPDASILNDQGVSLPPEA